MPKNMIGSIMDGGLRPGMMPKDNHATPARRASRITSIYPKCLKLWPFHMGRKCGVTPGRAFETGQSGFQVGFGVNFR